ncbi:hypothetical protein P9112_012262 [Eukaryota sp. TZLM1-RC]
MYSICILAILCLASALTPDHSSRTFWGTYKPGHFFGVRSRSPDSFHFGVAWMSLSDPQALSKIRHECTKNELDSGIYLTYKQHDFFNFAVEEILDHEYNLNLTISFVKTNDYSEWSVSVETAPIDSTKPLSVISIFPYIRGPHDISITPFTLSNGHRTPLASFSQASGEYQFLVVSPTDVNFDLVSFPPGSESLFSQQIAHSIIGDKKNQITGLLSGKYKSSGNLLLAQVLSKGKMKFNCLLFKDNQMVTDGLISSRINSMKTKLTNDNEAFSLQFDNLSNSHRALAMSTLSNLYGGAGYWYGHSTVSERTKKGSTSLYATPDAEHFSFTPSRTFFPRSFLWDDGFHLMVVAKYEPLLAADVINSWISLIDETGWVAREQILGPEASYRVPSEFRTQYKHVSNPPALIMPVVELFDQLNEGSFTHDEEQIIRQALKKWLPKLSQHLKQIRKHCYKKKTWTWPDRDHSHCLSSGLDDYPRGKSLSAQDSNVDLVSWMCWAHGHLQRMSTVLSEGVYEYPKALIDCRQNLVDFHWSEKRKFFGDVTFKDDKRIVLAYQGYVGLFPVLFCHLNADDSRLSDVLNVVLDESALLSSAGVRSLSKTSKYFGTGENYWRGPVWININYLLLKALRQCYWDNNQARVAYQSIRERIITNINNDYSKTGYLFEQYNPIGGEGQKNYPFYGWSSLVLNILNESF